MSCRRDGALAGAVLAAFLFASVSVEASLSTPFFLAGVLGTIVFELLAARAYDRVRACWDRPIVQVTALVAGVAIAAVGAQTVPSRVLSAGIGALVAYLALISVVHVRDVLEDGRD